MARQPGHHFLQIPGPAAVPERVLHAIARQVTDHRGPRFRDVAHEALANLRWVFRTEETVVIYPSSGTGAWEAALVNTLSPGDRAVMVATGHFAGLWHALARRLGVDAELIAENWRASADAGAVRERLRQDAAHEIKAVCVVHNETSTGCVSDIAAVRRAMDEAAHPALLMVDTVSGVGSLPFEFDAWGVDVAVAGSQKGLMMPAGLGFNAVSPKALRAHERAELRRSYWDWSAILAANASGSFPYTPATNLLYGLNEAVAMLKDEGLFAVWERHARHGRAARAAVAAWGLETVCADEREASGVVTAVMMPDGHSADALRADALARDGLSLGNGLSRLADRVFRIGHLGDFNDLMLIGALGGVEMALTRTRVPHRVGGVQAAMGALSAPSETAMAAQ